MTGLGLRAYGDGALSPTVFPLPGVEAGTTRLVVRALPGASAIHLELVDGAQVVRRFEVEADGEESIAVYLERTREGELGIWSQGREVLSLPPDERYAPAPLLETPAGARALDLAMLVDGTLRRLDQGNDAGLLLAEPEEWRRHVDLFAGIAELMADGGDQVRTGVFAYGDSEPAGLRGEGLSPTYRLHPRDGSGWRLQPLTPDDLRARLMGIPPSSGGDFVDALADALDTCARLPWREGARRALLITGDSPGYSILHPAPVGAGLLARDLDVDTRAAALHRLGVEVVTFYHPRPGAGRLGYERLLLEHAEDQFRRLASRRDLAFDAAGAEPEMVVRRLREGPPRTVRGAGYGVLESLGDDG